MKLVWHNDAMLVDYQDYTKEEDRSEWHLLPEPPDSRGCRACVLVDPDGTARLYQGTYHRGTFENADAAMEAAGWIVSGGGEEGEE